MVLIFQGSNGSMWGLKDDHATRLLHTVTSVPSNSLPLNDRCCKQTERMNMPQVKIRNSHTHRLRPIIIPRQNPLDLFTLPIKSKNTDRASRIATRYLSHIPWLHLLHCFNIQNISAKVEARTIVFNAPSLLKACSCLRPVCSINHSFVACLSAIMSPCAGT